MKKSKISLLKDLESSMSLAFDKDKQKNRDERVIKEKNEIVCEGLCALVSILTIFALISNIAEFGITIWHIMIVIGIVEYGMLIAFCKKCLIKDNEMFFTVFIGSILTLPASIFNHTTWMDKSPFIFVILMIVLYQIANIIYKRAMKAGE